MKDGMAGPVGAALVATLSAPDSTIVIGSAADIYSKSGSRRSTGSQQVLDHGAFLRREMLPRCRMHWCWRICPVETP
jgi:hypothetical protein